MKQVIAAIDGEEFDRRTPQGVRGLKRHRMSGNVRQYRSHSARSAWIETEQTRKSLIAALVALRKECVD